MSARTTSECRYLWLNFARWCRAVSNGHLVAQAATARIENPARRQCSLHRPDPAFAEKDKHHEMRHQQSWSPESWYPVCGAHIGRRIMDRGKRDSLHQIKRSRDIEESD